MSSFSCRILNSLIPSLDQVTSLRQQNELKWGKKIEVLLKKDPNCYKPDNIRNNPEFTPYLVPLVVKAESGQYLLDMFQNKGIPVMTWPDLPPEVYNNKNIVTICLS